MDTKRGFTLAEVLITLSVIGVVAALTIPSLITNIEKKEYQTAIKKFYSTMSQNIMLSELEYGQQMQDDLAWQGGQENYYNYFIKYYGKNLNIVKSEKYSYDEEGKLKSPSTFTLADGSTIYIHAGDCLDIYFDANGPKKPNVAGKDLQVFLHCIGRKFGPYYIDLPANYTREYILNKCKTIPAYCSSLLQYDGWEFKEDYPW